MQVMALATPAEEVQSKFYGQEIIYHDAMVHEHKDVCQVYC
ncbi:MAG: hypothetical protein ACD_21C00285G0006 [uncultured bacterium]|nr:MAG: hypothetical protein ACD_21C00285G0006 [uncultured bacterium]